MIYDLHCHLDLLPSMREFAKDAKESNINILAVTTTPKAYEKEIAYFNSYENIKIALGLHPQLVSERYNELDLVEKYIEDAAYIGEIGLDYNRQFYSSKNKQIDVFENLIKWCSSKGGKVISIHSVHADKNVLDILEKYDCTKNNKCILHWFSGSLSQLRRAVEMECYFSINEMMMQSLNGRKLISNIPIDKVLVESDAPFINRISTPQQLEATILRVELYANTIWNHGSEIIHLSSKSLFK